MMKVIIVNIISIVNSWSLEAKIPRIFVDTYSKATEKSGEERTAEIIMNIITGPLN